MAVGATKVRFAVFAPLTDRNVVVAPCRVRFCPVAPTVRAPVGVMLLVLMPANVGELVTAISWIVVTRPAATLKFVLLNCAIPF